MGTRSLVILEDGYSCKGIYCLSDGYPQGVGLGLVLGYNKASRARQLIGVGAIGGIRFNVNNLVLSHKLFDEKDSDMKTFNVMPSARPQDPKNLHEMLKAKIKHYFAEFVYWGRVLETPEGEIVAWSCLDTAKGEYVNLYDIDPKEYYGKAYKVVNDSYGWKFYEYGNGAEREELMYGFGEADCYNKIGAIEFSPERDALVGNDHN